jgi:hypothetical protein
LPDGIRQKIQPGGVLTISPVQKDLDTGVYTCWARNKQGHSARRSGEIVVTGECCIKSFYYLHINIMHLFEGNCSSRSISHNYATRVRFRAMNNELIRSMIIISSFPLFHNPDKE